MALVMTLRADVDLPIDLSSLQPDEFTNHSLADIGRRTLRVGNAEVPLGDLFSLSGSTEDPSIYMEGNLHAAVGLGSSMASGSIVVRGSIGPHAGARMTGGRLVIHGNAGVGLGGAMVGGTIQLHGSAGDEVGFDSAHLAGMLGGTIVVDGDAGRDAGRKIRRGTIAVRGSVGEGAMTDAVAGTLVVLGSVARRSGSGMRRGTLFSLGEEPIEVLPTFRRGRACRPLVLSLLLPHLSALGLSLDSNLIHRDLRLFHGDLTTIGLGEIFALRSESDA
jgi:formylmethanofuran dehydrogenase subunit C